jgi:hypothetical protein
MVQGFRFSMKIRGFTSPKPKKTSKSSTFSPGFVRGSQGKEPRRVHAYIPNHIPKRKASKPPQENRQEKVLKITKKGKRGKQHKALRNHA